MLSREVGVPGEEGGPGRWSLDHLLLDQDAIPTLVEVKRSSDAKSTLQERGRQQAPRSRIARAQGSCGGGYFGFYSCRCSHSRRIDDFGTPVTG